MVFRECRRFFRSSPLLAVTGVLLLTIGIGVSSAAYCLLSVFFAPRFPGMRTQGYSTLAAGDRNSVLFPVSWQRFDVMRQQVDGLVHVAAYSPSESDVDVSVKAAHRKVKVAAVSAGFFSYFTLPLLSGRDLREGETISSAENSVILAAPLAQSLFGSPQQALGQGIALNGVQFHVVGVSDPSFHGLFGDNAEIWTTAHSVVPLHISFSPVLGDATAIWRMFDEFYMVIADDRRSSEDLAASIDREIPRRSGDTTKLAVAPGISLDPGRDSAVRHWLRLGLGFSLVLAAVSCLNVCMLLLARAPLLVHEARLKQALGASHARNILELVAGPGAMMTIGLAGAVLCCVAALFFVARLSTLSFQMLRASAWATAGSLGITVLIALGLAVGVAVIPAIVVMRSSASPKMGSTTTASRYTIWLMQWQVSLQICCGIAVVILAAMITSSLLAILRVPLGFDPEHRFVVSLEPSNGAMTFSGTTGASTEFLALNQVIQTLRMTPGVAGVSYAGSAPFAETPVSTNVIENPDAPLGIPIDAERDLVTAGFFQTIGSRILRGRDLSDWLKTGIDHEAVVNAQLAHDLFPGTDPVGRTIFVREPARYGLAARRYPLTVVGVVENARWAGYASSPRSTFFQEAHASTDAMPHLVVYCHLPELELETSTQEAVRSFMRGFKLRQVYSLSAKVNGALAPDRYRAIATFAGAVAMAAVTGIGLYGALMFFVRSKRREIAVRICLGATPGSIRWMVVRRALQAAGVAAVLSLPFSFLLYRLSSSDLLGAASWSTGRAALITVLGVTAAVLLALVPAWRSTSESPATVLKEQ